MFRAYVEWRQRRRAVRELSKLSDLELADLGMVRREIAGVVRSGINRDVEGSFKGLALSWPEIKAVRRSFMNAGLLSGA